MTRDGEQVGRSRQSAEHLSPYMDRDSNTEDARSASTKADSILLVAIQRGEESAMALLFEKHSKLVYSIALRILRDRAAAEDIMQEVFLQVWRSPEVFSAARGSVGGFLAVVTRNRSIDVLRRIKPTDSVEDVPLASPFDLAAFSERKLMIEHVRKAMNELSREQTEALEMAFFGGCTHSEIAEFIGAPLGTVKTRVRSALKILGKALTGE